MPGPKEEARVHLATEIADLQASYDRLFRQAKEVQQNPASGVQLLSEVALRLSQLRRDINDLRELLEALGSEA